jgi:hypothetical protein
VRFVIHIQSTFIFLVARCGSHAGVIIIQHHNRSNSDHTNESYWQLIIIATFAAPDIASH